MDLRGELQQLPFNLWEASHRILEVVQLSFQIFRMRFQATGRHGVLSGESFEFLGGLQNLLAILGHAGRRPSTGRQGSGALLARSLHGNFKKFDLVDQTLDRIGERGTLRRSMHLLLNHGVLEEHLQGLDALHEALLRNVPRIVVIGPVATGVSQQIPLHCEQAVAERAARF
eukprot:scaffold1220_cov259-Pinguiococcus_pyrenoidosus.AAC.84